MNLKKMQNIFEISIKSFKLFTISEHSVFFVRYMYLVPGPWSAVTTELNCKTYNAIKAKENRNTIAEND